MAELAAIYTLYNSTPSELRALADTCDKEARDNISDDHYEVCRPAPQPHWPVDASASTETQEREIERIIAFHQENCVGDDSEYDKLYLAVAKTPEWRDEGVLLVTLNKYDFGAGTDLEDEIEDEEIEEWQRVAAAKGYASHMFKASMIGVIVQNLQIANMGWDEYLEWDEAQPGESATEVVDDDDDDDDHE